MALTNMAYVEQALALHQKGKYEDAERIYMEILSVDPNNAHLNYLMAVLYSDWNKGEKALRFIERATALAPDHCDYLVTRAELIARFDSILENAVDAFECAISKAPHDATALARYGMFWVGRTEYGRALPFFAKALELNADYDVVWLNCGNVLRKLGRTDEAIAHFEEACRLDSGNALAWNCLGEAFQSKGLSVQAIESFRKSIALNPGYAIALANLGISLHKAGQIGEAIEAHRRCVDTEPDEPSYKANLASALRDCCRHEEALELMCEAVEARPHDATVVSKWLYSLNFVSGLQPCEIESAHTQVSQCYAVSNRNWPMKKRVSGERIRIGFLSGDFCAHSVAFFIEPLLELLNRGRFLVACYSEVAAPDDTTLRLQNLADLWRTTCGLNATTVGELIEKDEIDVLIDLSGHTSGGRLDVVAQQPARVILNWLGYPNYMAWSAYGGRLVDGYTDPENEPQGEHTEQAFRIENSFLCYRGRASAPAVEESPALKNGYVTFGSFNNAAKLNEQVFEVWARVLVAVENSRLVLKSWQYVDDVFRSWLLERFSDYGILAERIAFRERVSSYDEHLACYGEVDIALDTFPYNGTTTTCEALWMGVPVVGLQGDRHASRVGSSLLRSLDREGWLASDLDAYVSIASSLADDLAGLNKERLELRNRFKSSPLGNEAAFAAAFSETIERALAEPPRNAARIDDMVQQGLKLQMQGQLEDARAIYMKALQEGSSRSDLFHYLGVACYQLKEFGDARACLEEAARLDPDNAEILTHWGSALQQVGRLEDAIGIHVRATELMPENPVIHNNYANALLDSGKAVEAVGVFERCLELNEGNAQAWCNYGLSLKETGRLFDAIAAGNKAIELDPLFSGAYSNLGVFLVAVGKADGAIGAFKRSIELEENAVWPWSNLIYALQYADGSSNQQIAEAVRGFAASLERLPRLPAARWQHDRLRVGFVSADFREHAVARFLLPLLDNPPGSVALYLYSDSPKQDAFTNRLRQGTEEWRNIVGMSDGEVAQRVRKDEIDILVDLAGHSARNRLAVFAMKPATVQATWLGFPGSTGLKEMDLRIVDSTTLSENEASLYPEVPLYLESGYHCISIEGAPEVSSLPAASGERFTFGSFNNLSKVGEGTIAAWARILKQAPDTLLALKAYQLEDAGYGKDLLSRFEEQGICASRIVAMKPVSTYSEHLRAYGGIDLALDCFPYNGTTTTCEALYMGVPVVTFQGERACARVGASLLGQVGLDEFVCSSVESYVDSAVRWSSRLDMLVELRSCLRQRVEESTLGDGVAFASTFFDALIAACDAKVK